MLRLAFRHLSPLKGLSCFDHTWFGIRIQQVMILQSSFIYNPKPTWQPAHNRAGNRVASLAAPDG